MEDMDHIIVVLFAAGLKESQRIEDEYIEIMNDENLSARERDFRLGEILQKNGRLSKAMDELRGALEKIRNSMRGVSLSGSSANPANFTKVRAGNAGSSDGGGRTTTSQGSSGGAPQPAVPFRGSPMWMLTSQRAMLECALGGSCFEGVVERPPGY